MYPALSVAAALAAAGERERLIYVGSVGGMEEAIVARESALPFRALPAAALRGRGPIQLARGAATMAAGTLAARALIREQRPAAILGTGGYVCVPLFLAAKAMGVPTMIYLPDVVPGLAVKFLSRIATLTAVNVDDALPYLGVRVDQPRTSFVVTGYPVRAELFGQDRAACRRDFGLRDDMPVVLVYGGSRGARSVNRAIAALLPDLLARCQIIHVCGREGDESWLREAAAGLSPEQQGRYKLYPYLDSGGGDEVTGQGDTVTGWHGDEVSRTGEPGHPVTESPCHPVTLSLRLPLVLTEACDQIGDGGRGYDDFKGWEQLDHLIIIRRPQHPTAASAHELERLEGTQRIVEARLLAYGLAREKLRVALRHIAHRHRRVAGQAEFHPLAFFGIEQPH